MHLNLCLLLTLLPLGDKLEVRTGQVAFQPAETEARIAPQFQLKQHTFEFRQTPLETSATAMQMSELTFPSPVVTPLEANNTVHCEYFCPVDRDRKHPGVIVLHILGGDFALSRLFCRTMAHHG